jgi:hypothetical protein
MLQNLLFDIRNVLVRRCRRSLECRTLSLNTGQRILCCIGCILGLCNRLLQGWPLSGQIRLLGRG